MPDFQSPYVYTPAQRITVPDLYGNVPRGGTYQPMDVAGHQNMDVMNYMGRLKEGISAAHEIMKSKQVAQEASARAASAAWAKTQFNQAQKMSDWIDKNVSDLGTRLMLKGMLGQESGISWSGTGGGELKPGTGPIFSEGLRRLIEEKATPDQIREWIAHMYGGSLPTTTTTPSGKTTTTPTPQQKTAPDNQPTNGGPQKGHIDLGGGVKLGMVNYPQDQSAASNNVQNVSYPDLSGAGVYGGGSNFPSAVGFLQHPFYQNNNLSAAPTMTA